MLKIHASTANTIQAWIDDNLVLFSYNTPVAISTPTGFVKTSKKWSVTTSKHINKFLNGHHAEEVSQEEIEKIVTKNTVL